jgi:carboxypeptidase family protein
MVGQSNSTVACSMKPWKQLLLVAVSLAAPAVVFSQTGLTSLRGTITDPSGVVAVGAQVTVSNETVGFHASRITDSSGHYEFPQKFTPEGVTKAVDYFQLAIAIDPGYSVAYSGLADCSSRMGGWGFVSPERGFGAGRML